MKFYISFETGGTSIRFAIVGEDLSIKEFYKIPTHEFNMASDTFSLLCDHIESMIKRIGFENIAGICSSWAAMLDLKCRVLLSAPNIRGFDNFRIADRLEERFGLRTYIIRDCNALLLYEMQRLGLSSEKGVIVGVFLGTGLGNAMCFDGKLYNGANGACSELGHLTIRGVEDICVCGKKGCVEVLCSGKTLRELAEKKYRVPISEIFVRHLDKEDVYNIVKYSAIAIAAEITILDPKLVILGGGVMKIPGFPFESFETEIRDNLRFPNPRYSARFAYASGDDVAGVIGATINAIMVSTGRTC